MQSFIKHIKKHLLVFIATIIIIVIVDVALYATMLFGVIMPNYNHAAPEKILPQTADALTITGDTYTLAESQKEILSKNGIWGMLIDIDGNVVWDFELPNEIPRTYLLQDVALMSRGYLQDYPVFVWKYSDKLLVAGYPETSYIKLMSNYLPYDTVRVLPFFTLAILALDILILFFAYYISKRSITKNISPIADATTRLSAGKQPELKTKGDLLLLHTTVGNSFVPEESADTLGLML